MLMKICRGHIFGNPLVYLAIGTLLGAYIYVTINICLLLGVVLTTLFFLIILSTCNKKFAIMVVLISIISYCNIFFYYEINLPRSHIENIKIISCRKNFIIGQCRGKLINVHSNYNLKEGTVIRARINFYYKRDMDRGIVGNIKVIRIEKETPKLTFAIKKVKDKYYKKLNESIGKDSTDIIRAAAFGESYRLREDVKEEMKGLGIIHVTAISGFHVGIVYGALSGIFGGLIGIVGISVYVIFVGLKASALRAYIMIIIHIIGKKIYRNDHGISSLSLSSLVIIFLRPYYIMDIGFALSFLAMLGIILFNKKIKRVLYKLPSYLNKSVSVAIAAQALTIPYMIMVFEEINVSFLIGNVFLIPIISIIIILGNLGLIFFKINFIFNMIIFVEGYLMYGFNIIRKILFYISSKNISIGIDGCAFYILGLLVLLYNGYRKGEDYDGFDTIR